MAERTTLVNALTPHRDEAQETSQGLTIFEMLQDDQVTAQMQRALGDQIGADRMARIVQTAVRSNPKLAACTIPSIMGAALMCAQLNLEPGPFGHVYLIPRENKTLSRAATREAKENVKVQEVNFELGYLGMVELMYRHPDVKVVHADKVCEGDEFEYSTGPTGRFHHAYDPFGERGALRGYYAYVEFHSGGWRCEPMTEQVIFERHRARSDAYRNAEKSWDGKPPKRNSPWHTDEESMCLKSCLRVLFKFIPKAPGVGLAVGSDQAVIDVDLARYQTDGFNVTPNIESQPSPELEAVPEPEPEAQATLEVGSDGGLSVDALITAAKKAERIPSNKQRKTAGAMLLAVATELTGATFETVEALAASDEAEQLLAALENEVSK